MSKAFRFLGLTFAVVLLVGCSKDEEYTNSGLIIGRWECIGDYVEVDGSLSPSYLYDAGECIYEFTATHCIIHFEQDLLDGVPVEYKYNSTNNTLTVFGIVQKIYKLTETELELAYEEIIIGDINERLRGKSCFRRL